MRTRKTISLPVSLTPARPPKRILVPLDFSACSLQALRHALTLPRLCQAEFVLVHVVEHLHPGSMLEGSEIGRFHIIAMQEAEHRLAELARTTVKPHVPVRYLVRGVKR